MPIIEQTFMDLTQALDVDAFWAENELCQNFTTEKPRCSVSFAPDDHWIFEFMQVPSTLRYYNDKAYRDALHQQVNQITQTYVGKTFFDEDTSQHDPKRIENLFGCEFTCREGSTPWLTPVTDDPDDLPEFWIGPKQQTCRVGVFPRRFWRTGSSVGETGSHCHCLEQLVVDRPPL